jgi:hypothetical protein
MENDVTLTRVPKLQLGSHTNIRHKKIKRTTMTMTISTALSCINTPLVTGSLGAVAGATLPRLEGLLNSEAISLSVVKLLNILAISLSLFSVSQPGRMDGYQQSKSSEYDTEIAELMSNRQGGTLVSPKGWAFAIWAPIFLGELLFATTSTVLVKDGTILAGLLKRMSGGFIMAQIFQSLWAATFREKYVGKRKGLSNWLSALMLSGIASSLNRAHVAYTSSRIGSVLHSIFFFPISLHFGWTTAAALVNWNGNLAVLVDEPFTVASAGWASVVGAAGVAIYVTLRRCAPVYGFVICWALTACADGMSDRLDERNRLLTNERKSGWIKKKASGEMVLNRKGIFGAEIQKKLCTIGAIISAAAAVWTTIQSR